MYAYIQPFILLKSSKLILPYILYEIDVYIPSDKPPIRRTLVFRFGILTVFFIRSTSSSIP